MCGRIGASEKSGGSGSIEASKHPRVFGSSLVSELIVVVVAVIARGGWARLQVSVSSGISERGFEGSYPAWWSAEGTLLPALLLRCRAVAAARCWRSPGSTTCGTKCRRLDVGGLTASTSAAPPGREGNDGPAAGHKRGPEVVWSSVLPKSSAGSPNGSVAFICREGARFGVRATESLYLLLTTEARRLRAVQPACGGSRLVIAICRNLLSWPIFLEDPVEHEIACVSGFLTSPSTRGSCCFLHIFCHGIFASHSLGPPSI